MDLLDAAWLAAVVCVEGSEPRINSHAQPHCYSGPSACVCPRVVYCLCCRCYTYGQCTASNGRPGPPSYEGLSEMTTCGHWAYLTGSDRAELTGGAVDGVYPAQGGAYCRESEPTGTLTWPDPQGYSDASATVVATRVADDCQCLSAAEIGAACAAACSQAMPQCSASSSGSG